MTVGGYHNNFGVRAFGEVNHAGLEVSGAEERDLHGGHLLVEHNGLRAVAEEIDAIALDQNALEMRTRKSGCMILLVGKGLLKESEETRRRNDRKLCVKPRGGRARRN